MIKTKKHKMPQKDFEEDFFEDVYSQEETISVAM